MCFPEKSMDLGTESGHFGTESGRFGSFAAGTSTCKVQAAR